MFVVFGFSGFLLVLCLGLVVCVIVLCLLGLVGFVVCVSVLKTNTEKQTQTKFSQQKINPKTHKPKKQPKATNSTHTIK